MYHSLHELVFDSTRILFYGVGPVEMSSKLPIYWRPEYSNQSVYIKNSNSFISVEDIGDAALPPYTLLAIPGFILLCLVELIVGIARGRSLYRVNDGVASLSLGVVMLIVQCMMGPTVGLATYCYIWSYYGYQDLIPLDSWWHWAGLLLGTDLAYYWFHRTAHEYHLSWSAHSVHHSGEDYNFATALRQGALQQLTSWPFKMVVLPFVFHPGLFVMHSALNTLGQFWIHTQIIGYCGPLEYIFNTPSHHRMHHRPPGNCNYAGIFIVWDRVFGTFVAEDRQQDYYGLAKQYETFDPVWANAEHPRRIAENASRDASGAGVGAWLLHCLWRCGRKRVRHKCVFRPLAVFEPIRGRYAKSAPGHTLWRLPQGASKRARLESARSHWTLTTWAVLQFVAALGTSVGLLFASKEMTMQQRLCSSGAALAWLSCVGRLLDGKQMGLRMETVRVGIVAAWVIAVGTFKRPEVAPYLPVGPAEMPSWMPFAAVTQCAVWSGVFYGALARRVVASKKD